MEMYSTERFKIRNVIPEGDDVKYISNIRNTERYKKYISDSRKDIKYEQFMIIEKANDRVGLVRIIVVSYFPKIALVNIIATEESNPLNIYMIFDVVSYLFLIINVDKLMFQVKSVNSKMIKILKVFGIKKEGEIYYNHEYNIIFYGILREEFLFLRKRVNGRLWMRT